MNIDDKSVSRDGEQTSGTFRRVKSLVLAAAVPVVFTTFIACDTTSGSAFPVWAMSGLVRVGKTDTAGTVPSISLSSARGERVDTQVVVQGPSGGLTNVNVSASALIGPGGATIPASSVMLYREHYITVTGTANYGGGGNPPLGSGTYPEPLIPFNDPETRSPLCRTAATLMACNGTIIAGQNQPNWIDHSSTPRA